MATQPYDPNISGHSSGHSCLWPATAPTTKEGNQKPGTSKAAITAIVMGILFLAAGAFGVVGLLQSYKMIPSWSLWTLAVGCPAIGVTLIFAGAYKIHQDRTPKNELQEGVSRQPNPGTSQQKNWGRIAAPACTVDTSKELPTEFSEESFSKLPNNLKDSKYPQAWENLQDLQTKLAIGTFIICRRAKNDGNYASIILKDPTGKMYATKLMPTTDANSICIHRLMTILKYKDGLGRTPWTR